MENLLPGDTNAHNLVQVVNALTKVSIYSKQNEPEVLRYAIALPRDASDDKSVYVVEE